MVKLKMNHPRYGYGLLNLEPLKLLLRGGAIVALEGVMIDWNRVKELQDEVGPDDFGEVVELFLEEVEEVITRMKTAPDPSIFEEDLHFLKGSALNLGFAHFADLCQSGEKAALGGWAETINMEVVFDSYTASKIEFLEDLGPQVAA